jgi:hypothetical protein
MASISQAIIRSRAGASQTALLTFLPDETSDGFVWPSDLAVEPNLANMLEHLDRHALTL